MNRDHITMQFVVLLNTQQCDALGVNDYSFLTQFMYAFDNGLHKLKPAGHGNISKDATKRGNRRLLKIGRGI